MTGTIDAQRARKLWTACILRAIDDAMAEGALNEARGQGNNSAAIIRTWARSLDGETVLSLVGIEPGDRTVAGLMAFVERGTRTTIALGRDRVQASSAKKRGTA